MSDKIEITSVYIEELTALIEKKDSSKLVKFLMDHGIESYLLSMNEKDPSELGFENFWKRIEKTEQSKFSDIIKGKLYG